MRGAKIFQPGAQFDVVIGQHCHRKQGRVGGTGGTNPDQIDVTATGCSCNVGQSTSPAAAQLATAAMLLGLALLRRARKNPV